MLNRFLCVGSLVAACALVGCGDDGATDGQAVFPVSGNVKMSGSPLADATVAFVGDGEQPTATATTDADGNYELTTYESGDGAAEGNYKVVISKSPPVAASKQTESGGHAPESTTGHSAKPKSTELLPKQYTSSDDTPLTANVKSSGDNVFDFEIK